MKKLILLLAILCTAQVQAQNVGVDVPAPTEKLHIDGRLRLNVNSVAGAPTPATGGVVRWNGTDFEGWNGSTWVSFTSATAETDPVFTSSPSNGITSTNITNWNSAFGWGDHAAEGYLTAVTASNGLTSSGGITPNITLGGSLTGATTIAQTGNLLSFTSTAVNGFSVDGSTFSVDAANDRVGIGTAAPSQKLTVDGAVQIGTTSTNTSGTMRWNTTTNDFEGFDGVRWWSLTGMQERTMMYTGAF